VRALPTPSYNYDTITITVSGVRDRVSVLSLPSWPTQSPSELFRFLTSDIIV